MILNTNLFNIISAILLFSLLPLTCLGEDQDPSYASFIRCNDVEVTIPTITLSSKALYVELLSLRDYLQLQLKLLPKDEKDVETMFNKIDKDGKIDGSPLRHKNFVGLGHWRLSDQIESKTLFVASQISTFANKYYEWAPCAGTTHEFIESSNAIKRKFQDMESVIEVDLGKPELAQFNNAVEKCSERINTIIDEVEKVMGYCRIHGGLNQDGESDVIARMSRECSN